MSYVRPLMGGQSRRRLALAYPLAAAFAGLLAATLGLLLPGPPEQPPPDPATKRQVLFWLFTISAAFFVFYRALFVGVVQGPPVERI